MVISRSGGGFGPPGTAPGDGRPSFTIGFTTNENPISEGGKFYHTANWWANVRTGGNGTAWGLNGPNDAFDDAYAIISGTTGDYEMTVVVHRDDVNLNTAVVHEIELNCRFAETHSGLGIRGYETLMAFAGSADGIRWTHEPDGVVNFNGTTNTEGPGQSSSIENDDELKLTIIGNTRRIFHNGTLIATYVDSFYVDGELAIAYFTRPGGNSAHYCIKQLTVTPL